MKYFITIVLVLVFILSASAVLLYEKFTVYSGYCINTVDESISTRSTTECVVACNARNEVSPNTCRTATYNSVTKMCQFSSQSLSDATSGLGAEFKTITMLQDCSIVPIIQNGDLSIDTQSPTDSTATLQCHTGYVSLPNGPVTVGCSIYSGWSTTGIGCFLPPQTSYYGMSFITGFMKNGGSNYGVPTIFILSSNGEAAVTISIPYLAIHEQTTTVGGTLTRTFSNTITSATSGAISSNAVHITSDVPIILFSGSMKSGSADGSLVLPETSLMFNHIISGHPSTNAGVDEFIIIGTADATQVTLDFNGAALETITLNRMQTYHRQAADMSGTIINAAAPVYVLSGHICANVPDNTVLYCDYIEEMMPPIASLGYVHIVSFMKPRPDFTISIVSPSSNYVTVYDSAGNLIENVSLVAQVAIFRTYTNSATVSVVSDLPILVTQYGHGSVLVLGDPSMMIIPAITRYGHVYDFLVPTGFNTPSTLAIVMSDVYSTSGLRLSGAPVTPTQTITASVPGSGLFNVIFVDVTEGNHNLAHTSGNLVTFGAWLHGRTNNGEYAWSLGIIV